MEIIFKASKKHLNSIQANFPVLKQCLKRTNYGFDYVSCKTWVRVWGIPGSWYLAFVSRGVLVVVFTLKPRVLGMRTFATWLASHPRPERRPMAPCLVSTTGVTMGWGWLVVRGARHKYVCIIRCDLPHYPTGSDSCFITMSTLPPFLLVPFKLIPSTILFHHLYSF